METEENLFSLGVLVISSNDIQEVLDKMKYSKTEDGYAFAYEEDNNSFYEEFADYDGIIKLGIYHQQDNMFYKNDHLTEILAEENDTPIEELDLTFIPDLQDFIDEHDAEIEEEIDKVKDRFYAHLKIGEDNLESSETPEDSDSSSTTNFSINVPEDEGAGEELTSMINSKNQSNSSETQVNNAPSSVPETQQNMVVVSGNPDRVQKQTPDGNIDPLLTLAADIFENTEQIALPQYDKYTQVQLQKEILSAENKINDARDSAIFAIRDTLAANRETIEEAFENKFSSYKDKHEKTIQVIENNEKTKVEELRQKESQIYDQAKGAFIESQRAALADKYDQEHLATYQQDLLQKEQNLKAEFAGQMVEENDRYNEHYYRQKGKFLENNFRKIDFKDIFDSYQNIVLEQRDMLSEHATQFADQVALVARDLEQQRDNAIEEAKKHKQRADVLEDTMNSKIELLADEKATKRTQEYLEKNVSLQKSLQESQEVARKERERADSMFENNKKIQMVNDVLSKQNQTQVTNNVPATTTAVPVQKEEKTSTKSKAGVITSIILGVVAILGIAVGGTTLVLNHQRAVSQPQVVQTQSSSTSSVVSASSSSYKKGDKWTYHNTKDGKDYEVTMDNETTGHYTDGDGNQHQITLNK